MKKMFLTFTLVSFFFGSLMFVSCGGDDTDGTSDNDSTEVVESDAGMVPFDFPTVGTTAKAGEYVLAPSIEFIEDAWTEIEADPEAEPTFIFYSAKCVEPGDVESKIKQISDEVMIPNSLIIPIPAGQEAHNGDILLTWWQSGSGMERAIVIDDTDPTQPIVVYLDASYDEEGVNEEQLEANSFYALSTEWETGSFIVYESEYYMEKWQVIKVEGDKVLAKGWGGSMAVLEKSKCTAIPFSMNLAVGDVVQIPYIGSYQEGTITKIDEVKGRVWVETEFAGEMTEEVICFGEITTGLNLD